MTEGTGRPARDPCYCIAMSFQPLYTATAHAHGGREGNVRVDDGPIDLPLTMPKGLGGSGAPGANPEMLFAAGYSACFESAVRLVARMQKIKFDDVSITARVTIGKTEDGGFGLAAALEGSFKGLGRAEAEKLMHAAHQVCPYSKATRGNIEVTLSVAEQGSAA
jgi:osmotically inducible protein OsmC